jgi:hypothetical protein
MKRLLLTAVAALAFGSPAISAPAELPPPMLGAWCFDQQTTEDSERYIRGGCDDVDTIVIGPRTFDHHEDECDLIKANVRTDSQYRDIHTLVYRCRHLGPSRRTTNITVDMWLGKIGLVITRRK